MSPLDQAIIKAYAKDRPTAGAPPSGNSPSPPRTPAAARPCADAIDQLYREGTLYRTETRSAAPPIPAPHLPTLPPTSPRRSVRRSILRLMAAAKPSSAAEAPAEMPRIARKVIIRHISHGAAPSPPGMLRPGSVAVSEPADVHQAGGQIGRAKLPPKSIADKPASTTLKPPLPLPPQVAPLNNVLEASPPIEAHSRWTHDAVATAMVVLADAMELPATASTALESAPLEAPLPAEQSVATDTAAISPLTQGNDPTAPFIDQTPAAHPQERREFRIDAPHATGRHEPHAAFGPASAWKASEKKPSEQPEARAENEGWPPGTEELDRSPSAEAPVAEPVQLDRDMEHASDGPTAPAVGSSKPAVPLWEVDRFHWPRAVEKLLSDQEGYLARAGDKLLAAVQDGLRVLAITGNRRGEGRTTLALCLARVAAKSGVQVAVMDADFARPQLAGKIALEVAHGWQDAALGRIPLSEAAVKSLADNITVLALESSARARSLSLADPRVTATIRAAAATFELLILDLGPLVTGERIAFPSGEACPLDAAIVVCDTRFATVAESETIGHALQDAGVEAVGIAENFVVDEEALVRPA